MSMTETPTPAAAPKPKRKYSRKAKPAAAAKPKSEFEGMTGADCCLDCNVNRCVITGVGICGHPFKGGLQAPFQRKPEIVSRYARARRYLADNKP